MKLLIKDANVDFSNLSTNPAAIQLLEAEPELIDWDKICFNPAAGDIIYKYQYMLRDEHWWALSSNPSVIKLLKEFPNKICWNNLLTNPNPEVIPLIEAYIGWNQTTKRASKPYYIDWFHLSSNPNAVHLLKAYPNMIDYYQLATNPSNKAIELLKQYIQNGRIVSMKMLRAICLNPCASELITIFIDKMDDTCWENLCYNQGCIHILKSYPSKIDWKVLSANPEAIDLLKCNIDKIDWMVLHDNPKAMLIFQDYPLQLIPRFIWSNPSIFAYNYASMRASKSKLHEDMIQTIFAPKRIHAWLTQHGDLDNYLP